MGKDCLSVMKDEEMLISVVMPAYNAVSTIRESIQSVIEQDYKNWELIVVNDCSTDGTKEVVSEYTKVDDRIRLINKEHNEGVGKARNTGISLAKGEWIAFLDSDDLWTAEKLSKVVALMGAHPEGKLFFTASAFIDYEGNRSDYILQVPEKIDYEELLKQNLISCSSVVVSKETMAKNEMPSGIIHEDYAAWLSILKQEPYAYGLNEALLVYRLSKKSKSGNKLKAAKMNWRTYRAVGVPFFKTVKCMAVYIARSLKKYSSI